MKTISILLLFFVSNFVFGQVEYRYFETINGEEECARLRYFEVNKMIRNQDFTLLKYIYPKLNNKILKELEKVSKKINDFYKPFGNSGAERRPSTDSKKLRISFLVYEQKGIEINDLISLEFKIEKEPPFFIDTIIIGDSLILSDQVRGNLQMKNIIPYPPLSPYFYNCFGHESNFELGLDKNKQPYLYSRGYEYLFKNHPDFIDAAEKMNVPISTDIRLAKSNINTISSLGKLNNLKWVTIRIGETDSFPSEILGNQTIEDVNFYFYGDRIKTFVLPDDITSMQKLKTISFTGDAKVKLPEFLYRPDNKIRIKDIRGKIQFEKKE